MHTISIITPCFNASMVIETCLNTVSEQDVIVQHVIVDGGSSDQTLDIINRHSRHQADAKSEPDNGIYDAMNKGVARATGDIIGILNSDDFYASDDVLSTVADVFKDESVEACYGDLKYVDSDDLSRVTRYWRSGRYNVNKFYWGWMPPHPTFFVRKSVYERFGGFNLELGSAADYEFMLRVLLKHKIKAVYIPKVLVHMRTGGVSNATISNRLKANVMDRKAWEVNGLKPYPWTIAMKPLRKILQWFVKS